MTTDILKQVFESIMEQAASSQWNILLLNYGYSKRADACWYQFRSLNLLPATALPDLIKDICEKYLDKLSRYEAIEPYNATNQASIIYTFKKSDAIIAESYDALLDKLSEPDDLTRIRDFPAKGYAISGEIKQGDETIPVKLFNLSVPYKTLKHRFRYTEGIYEEISEPVLALQTAVSLLGIGDTLYMLDATAENLFHLERSFKLACVAHVDSILESKIVSDSDLFRAEATTGFNPRTFVSFSEDRLNYLKSKKRRVDFAKKYSLAIDESGALKTENSAQVKALIKVLCGKAMEDPMNGAAMEVPSSRAWST